MIAMRFASKALALLARYADAEQYGYPIRGINGPGDNPPLIDDGPPWRGWTRYRDNPIQRTIGGTVVYLFRLRPELAARIAGASATQIMNWLNTRLARFDVTVTLPQAQTIKTAAAAAVEEPDSTPDDVIED